MGKLTDALRKAAGERLARIEKLDQKSGMRYEFVARTQTASQIDARIVAFHDPKSPVAEQYRTLRTNIQALKTDKPLKAIVVTSSTHSEGKTITALNLAISMAHDLSKKKILLVDADLRRGRVSRYLGLTHDSGLADILTNGTAIEETLLAIQLDNLTILPAGKLPHNPAELLGSPALRNLMSLLKSRYDYLIFDTPPIVPVTDAGLLGAQADGVILVIQANHTQRGVVKHAEALLAQAQAKLVGYILTNIQYHIPAYIYRYL